MCVFDGCANRHRAIRQHLHVDGGWQRALQLRQQRFDAVYRFNHVGTGLALDVEDDTWQCIGPSGKSCVLGIINQIRHIVQTNRRACFVGDDQIGILSRRFQLVIGIDGGCARGTVKAALGLVHIGSIDGGAQVFH